MLLIQKHTKALLVALLALIGFVGLSHFSRLGSQPASYNNSFHAQSLALVLDAIKPASDIQSAFSEQELQTLSSQNDCGKNTSFVAYVRALNTQLARLSKQTSSGNALLSDLYAVDLKQLLDDKKQQNVIDNHLCFALRDLTNYQLKHFEAMYWREHASAEHAKNFGSQHVMLSSDGSQQAAWAKKFDPWANLPSCALLQQDKATLSYFDHRGATELCKLPQSSGLASAAALPVHAAPKDWYAIQAELGKQKYQAEQPSAGKMSVKVLGRDVEQAPHVVTTLNGQLQLQVQKLMQCMTAGYESAAGGLQNDDCKALGISLPAQFAASRMYEQAAARMTAAVVMDVATGEIQALGSSHTRCYRHEHDGPGRDADCPSLPSTPRWRPHMLENHALHTTAFPGSLVKPVAAVAMMLDPDYKKKLLGSQAQAFRVELQKSSSERFHDRLFCADKQFKDCTRPANLLQAAQMFGWSRGCDTGRCERALLTDGALQTEWDDHSYLRVSTGRMALETVTTVISPIKNTNSPTGTQAPPLWRMPQASFSPEWALACSQSGNKGWEKCQGGRGSATELLAEAWGQGNSQVSPMAVAKAYARLAQAANGKDTIGNPHLLQAHITSRLQALKPQSSSLEIPSDAAELIMSGLSLSHRGGTAAPACTDVYGSAAICAAKNNIAGKTGTPTFDHDVISIAARAKLCAANAEAMKSSYAATQKHNNAQLKIKSACDVLPYKWYAGLIKSPGSNSWDKVVVVLTERNWRVSNGMVDSPGDSGINVSAWTAMQIFKMIENNAAQRSAS